MNSLLQQLFMLPSIRASVLSLPSTHNNPMLTELQKLFCTMDASLQSDIDTLALCKAYRDPRGQAMDMGQQMDVEEYMNQFFDRIEDPLKGTAHAHMLKDVLGGKVAQQVISKVGCDTV